MGLPSLFCSSQTTANLMLAMFELTFSVFFLAFVHQKARIFRVWNKKLERFIDGLVFSFA